MLQEPTILLCLLVASTSGICLEVNGSEELLDESLISSLQSSMLISMFCASNDSGGFHLFPRDIFHYPVICWSVDILQEWSF